MMQAWRKAKTINIKGLSEYPGQQKHVTMTTLYDYLMKDANTSIKPLGDDI